MIPAALVAMAIAIPGGSATADPPPDHVFCPNATNWLLVPAFFQPNKNNNDDAFVCMKIDGSQPVKDNNNPSPNPDDYDDNVFPYLP
jgi:hypothetical protein